MAVPPEVPREVIATAVREQRRYEHAKVVLVAVAAALAALVFALLLTLALQTRGIAAGVESCVTPGGECYDRSVQSSDENTQNLELTRENQEAIAVILGILETEHPEAAATVRARLRGSTP